MSPTSKKTRATKHISFTMETFCKLETYIKGHFGNHKALSMIVDRAVEEYLDRHDKDGEL